MNNARRKKLSSISKTLAEVRDLVDGLMNEEQECLDNMPENLMDSERYIMGEEAVDNMDDAIIAIEDAIESIDAAKQ